METPSLTTNLLFHEDQQFRQPWIWLLMLLISIVTAVAVFKAHSLGLALVLLLIDAAIVVFIYSLKLTTEVRPDGIHVRFFPLLIRQTIPFSDIASYEVRTYRPILEYGGWGVRYGWKGKAYNVRGNRGVQLYLKNNRRLLIGSQRAEEFAAAVAAGMRGG